MYQVLTDSAYMYQVLTDSAYMYQVLINSAYVSSSDFTMIHSPISQLCTPLFHTDSPCIFDNENFGFCSAALVLLPMPESGQFLL